MKLDKAVLEKLYRKYNKRQYVHPDPLEFLYRYRAVRDREIVALIASSMAFGRVLQILKSLSFVFGKMGDSPYRFVMMSSKFHLRKAFRGFRHRFVGDKELICFLTAIRNVLKKYGSLNNCFLADATADNNIFHFLDS